MQIMKEPRQNLKVQDSPNAFMIEDEKKEHNDFSKADLDLITQNFGNYRDQFLLFKQW